MTELLILEITLIVFGTAFAIKNIVFGVLAKTMYPAPPGLSRALFFHYLAISVQAFFLALIYFMYVALLNGNGPDVPYRIALYIASMPSVVAVDVSGAYLLFKYLLVRDEDNQVKSG